MLKTYLAAIICFVLPAVNDAQSHIDGKALLERHTIINNHFDSLSSLSIGNGRFAFTVDVTGLQSFSNAYVKGVPLGTESEWGNTIRPARKSSRCFVDANTNKYLFK